MTTTDCAERIEALPDESRARFDQALAAFELVGGRQPIATLVSSLLTDDEGRRGVVDVLADELAAPGRCRGLRLIDDGREEVVRCAPCNGNSPGGCTRPTFVTQESARSCRRRATLDRFVWFI